MGRGLNVVTNGFINNALEKIEANQENMMEKSKILRLLKIFKQVSFRERLKLKKD